MSGSKIPVVILIAIAVLFVVGIAAGGRDDGQPADPGRETWVHRFAKRLVPSVDAASVESGCLDRSSRSFVLRPSTPCMVAIPAATHFWQKARRLQLRRAEGSGIQVAYAGKDSQLDSNQPVIRNGVAFSSPPGTKSFSIPKEGGELALRCAEVGPSGYCRVAID